MKGYLIICMIKMRFTICFSYLRAKQGSVRARARERALGSLRAATNSFELIRIKRINLEKGLSINDITTDLTFSVPHPHPLVTYCHNNVAPPAPDRFCFLTYPGFP